MRGLPQRQQRRSPVGRWARGWGPCLSLIAFVGLCPTVAPAQRPATAHAAAARVTAAPATSAPADTALDRYLHGLTTLRTDFTQRVTDAAGKPSAGGSGSLVVQRPDRFRWDYRPAAQPGEGGAGGNADEQGQLLVADGRNLWFYDRELAQVTVKPIDAALSSTPIMLLSGSSEALRTQFDISAAPAGQGLQWVQVRPRGAQADFSEARLGFRGDDLARMIVHNMLGQTVQLDFSHSQRNAPLDAGLFDFKAPPGVDVIGTALPVSGS